MTQSRTPGTSVALLLLSFFGASLARADDPDTRSPLSLRLQLDAGAGTHASSLPGANGARRLAVAWFPVAGFRLAALHAVSERLRIGAELSYVSSTAFEVSRAIAPNTVELGDARAQEINVLGRVAIVLQRRARAQPIVLPLSLGYGFDAFTTNAPLTAAQGYLLSGPRIALGIEVPLWTDRIHLAGRAELGANVTQTAALRDAGVSTLGLHYAFQAEADVMLTGVLRLGLRFRQAEVQLPMSGSGTFHEQRRLVMACLTLRNLR